MEPRAVIFDMDGVLIDSLEAHFRSWNRMLEQHGLSMSRQEFTAGFGRTSREIIAENWPEQAVDSETIGQWDDQKEAAFREILRESFPAMDGAQQLITRLDEAGFRLAVGSSGPRENVQAAMENLPGAQRFSAVVTGNDVSRGKPHPEVFLKAAERLGVEPGRCAVVEDAVAGLQAATAAGMVAIGLTGTTERQALDSQADVVVESLHDLSVDGLSRWIEQNARQEG